jgi:hypothetical protein
MSSPLPFPPEPRDAYLAANLHNGRPWLYAVKSDGNRADKIFVVRPAMTIAEAFRRMRAYLDEIDPVPQLRLVKATSAPPASAEPRSSYLVPDDAIAQMWRELPIRARRIPFFRS